jgi:hypothetical protein
MKTVYHYTDKSGFGALSSGAPWYPSAGMPIDPQRALLDHMQLSVLLSSVLFYIEQYKARDYAHTSSAYFQDAHYGPGWYVTETPPNATTQLLLTELWQGNLDAKHKTEYWLKLAVPNDRLKAPDPRRPSVAYLPLFDRRGGDFNRPAGGSSSFVYLVKGGRRTQDSDGRVIIDVVHSYNPPITIISPFLAVFDGWSCIPPDKQCNILGFLGLDSGFPGVPFPVGSRGLSVQRKQLFAIAQIATRSLGTELHLLDVFDADHCEPEQGFAFEMMVELTLQENQLKTLVHCRHQESPMRLEHVRSLVERAHEQHADAVVAFVTSTFAENSIAELVRARIAPVLVTAAQRQDPRPRLRLAIMDGEVVEYPAHDFWIPVATTEGPRFQEVRTKDQILRCLGRAEGVPPESS